jgi:signal transduction histidine kinase
VTLSDRTLRRLHVGVLSLVILLYAAGATLVLLALSAAKDSFVGSGGVAANVGWVLITLLFPLAGSFIARRQPRNAVGWVLLGTGASWGLSLALGGFASFAWLGHHRLITLSHVAVDLFQWSWVPGIGLTGTFLLLLFPDGKLPSRRWQPVAWLAGAAMGLVMLLGTVLPGNITDTGFPTFANPLGIAALRPLTTVVFALILAIPVSIVASAASVVVRYRRSRGLERLQMKWLAAAGCAVASLFVLAVPSFLPLANLRESVSLLSFGLIPLAVGIAILKYRLYDIDLVVNKALVYGALAAFISAVYVGIVVGIGHAVGSNRSLGLSIAATAVVAVAFQPVRERVQRVANRLVYGRRAAPYEVLSDLSNRMAGAYATDELLPPVARLLAEGTGAQRAEVWLRLGDELVREAVWPEEPDAPVGPDSVRLPREGPPEIPGSSRAVEVRDGEELLGALAIVKPRGEPLTPPEDKLAGDLGRQAGLILRNVRLVEELRASRQRIVAAQDDERRRLERDIHDGAQQQLVTLSLATRLAQSTVGPDASPKLLELLDRAAEELKLSLAELRELARGIHPRILTERGLGAAIQFLAERSPVPVTVRAEANGRLPGAIEATAYFAVSEALANVAKYSKATSVEVITERRNGSFVVRVRDDGVGGADPAGGSGLRGLFDRVAAVGGRIEVDSPQGRGTQLTIELPGA